MVEGWVIIKGERRFIPLGRKQKSRHCKSCAKFRKSGDVYYCDDNPDLFIDPDSEACDAYVNRTWGQRE
jgi:hypothetical protein